MLLYISDVSAQSKEAYQELNDELSRARKLMDHQQLGDAYYNLAWHEETQRYDYAKAFDHYNNSLTYFKLLNDTLKIKEVEQRIAFRFKEAELYSDAIDIYEELLIYYQSKGDTLKMINIFSELASVYKERGDLDQQQVYLSAAIELNLGIRDTSAHIQFLREDIKRLIQLNTLDSAIRTAFKAFEFSNQIESSDLKAQTLFDIAYVNKLQGNYQRAIKYFKNGEALLSSRDYDKNRLRFYQELSDCYALVSDYQQAYEYNQRYSALNDSILDKDRQEALNNANIRYQINEKNKDILNLEREKKFVEDRNSQQRTVLYFLMFGLGLVLLLLYYSIRFYTQKIKTEGIITEQKGELDAQRIRELEDKVKISSMQSMLEGQEKERERVAKDLHDSLGGLLSTIKLQFDSVRAKREDIADIKEYKKANSLLDTAVEEIRTISQNMQPGALSKLGLIPAITDMINRFDNEKYPDIDFQFYDIPKSLAPTVALSIYRIVQELLHNSIKHAKASEILIQLNKDGDELVLQYEDDGVGFDPKNIRSKGMGLSNIQSRVHYMKGNLEVDTVLGEGTSYLINVSI